MPILARDKNQLTLIYSSLSQLGKQVLGYVQGANKKIEVIDIAKEKLGDTIWIELANDLGMPFSKIFASDYIEKSNIDNFENFNEEDWIKIINNNPKALQNPIAINGDQIMQIFNRFEILKFFSVDSAGIEKGQKYNKAPTRSSSTEDEHFI